ncbi:MAG: PEP/pyruvate-binding domain-containing protein [Terriglobia bacterium]
MGPTQARPFILRLDSPDATLDLVGGKGASLARMAASGLPVPPGFHITTHAYRKFVSENLLEEGILSAVAHARGSLDLPSAPTVMLSEAKHLGSSLDNAKQKINCGDSSPRRVEAQNDTGDDPTAFERASAQILALFEKSTIPEDIAVLIEQSYNELGKDDPPVAVRSSATAEDLPGMSFAGQMETYLNERGGAEVLAAVKRCWGSLWTARALSYRAQHGIRPEDVSIAVVVQQLVPAEVAGILFTANPLTGARDQIMINAAWGLGEAIVGGQVTPDTITVAKQTGEIVSQEIAVKEVMTSRVPGGTRDEPVPAERRRQAALQPEQASELARLGRQIEQLYGLPMDIEWAISGRRIFILQARPITALPEPCPTLEWKLPRAGGQYARNSVIELLPNPLSPLFATLALPMWNEALQALVQTIGFDRGLAEKFRLQTINDYAYTEFGLSAWQSVKLAFALIALLPTFVRLLRSGRTRWADDARPHYSNVGGAWVARDLAATTATDLLAGAREIVKAAAGYYTTIQSGILPCAFMSEPAFATFYDRLVKRQGDPMALTFLLGFDSAPIQAEKSLYDLASWARTQPELAAYLERASSKEIAQAFASTLAPITDAKDWREFAARFAQHLERFGHAVYDLDFASPVPADDPAPLLETLKYFLSGQARSPYERQATATRARQDATEATLARLRGLRLRIFSTLVRTAQRYAPLREDALADVGLGWPILRRMLRELGRRMVAAGAIARPEDVFFLECDEVQAAAAALDAGRSPENYARVVAERRATRETERKVTPPVALPVRDRTKFLGIDVSRWMPAHTGQAAGAMIKGIGASPGRVSGIARVIHGPDEFHEMHPGDILVAKITTPAWTALFALASGVVTDVGGPLSHSSIVAREYHIPAVLGTGVATERLHSAQRISVDGDAGTVTIVD